VQLRTSPVGLSGAAIGGLLFGAGMILARGCASRHLVLAATGNLRAWVTFAVFSIVALASISGPLAPLRRALTGLLAVHPSNADVLALAGLSASAGIAIGAAIIVAAVALGLYRGKLAAVAAGLGVGLSIAAGWALTSALAGLTFEPTQVETLAFTAPSANFAATIASAKAWSGDWLWTFDLGLIPGVFFGALLAGLIFRELEFQWFASLLASVRYLAGAALMGLGGVSALGCTIGSIGNAALMITSSWVALVAIWVGAAVTHRLVDARSHHRSRGDRSVLPAGLPAAH